MRGAGPARTTPSAASRPPSASSTRHPSGVGATAATGVPVRTAPGGRRAASAVTSSSMPLGQRHEEAPAGAARPRRLPGARRPPEPEDQAAVLLLEGEEPRHGRREGQAVRVRRVDPPDEWLRHPLERLPPEPPPHEAPEALVPARAPARQDHVQPESELPAPGEDARSQDRPDASGGQEQKPLGQRLEPAPAHDVRAAKAIVRPAEPRPEADALREREGPRLLGDEGVRAGLEQEPVRPLGPDGAAQAAGRFEEDEVERTRRLPGELDQPVRGREPGDAAPDHDDPERRHAPPPRRSIRDARGPEPDPAGRGRTDGMSEARGSRRTARWLA